MRIAMVSPYDLAVPGGVQGQVLGLSAALRDRGHQVTVIAPVDRGGPHTDGVISVGRSMRVRANGSIAPISISPLSAARAAHALRRSGIDVVHLHEPLAPAANYGCLLSARQPIVGTFHRNGSSALYRAFGPGVRWVLGRLSARCAVSEAARDNVVAGRGDFEVLFNGVDIEAFDTDAPTPTIGPTILFVGRHEPRKGLAVLLEAFTSIDPPATLWVAGDGPATAELRRRYPSSSRLQWLGPISEDEKARRMAGADVFCAPSLGGESFGMVLLEAMAARCALVASDIDGYRAAAGDHARLVPPSDAAALAEALIEMVSDAQQRRARSSAEALEAARQYAARWSMASLAGRYAEIYERVLAGTDGPREGSGPR
jgi:phosphatidyl-myo-inositol alpha-mannosyltransferase